MFLNLYILSIEMKFEMCKMHTIFLDYFNNTQNWISQEQNFKSSGCATFEMYSFLYVISLKNLEWHNTG